MREPSVQIETIRCPFGKTGYVHKADARTKLEQTQREGSNNPRKPVRIYRCPSCTGWHLTSAPYRPRREE